MRDDQEFSKTSGMPPPRITGSAVAAAPVFDPNKIIMDFGELAFRTHAAGLDVMMSSAAAVQGLFAGQLDVLRRYLSAHAELGKDYSSKRFAAHIDEAFKDWLGDRAGQGDSHRQATYRFLKTMMNAHHTTLEAIEEQIEFLPPPLRAWVKYKLMYDKQVADVWEKHGAPAAFSFIGKMLPGAGALHHPDYNGKFLAEDQTGQLVAVDPDRIAARFAKGQPRPLPHLVMTSSHAQGESLADATRILHGIEAIARDCGHPLKLAHAGEPMGAEQTLVMMACDTDRNALLNAGHLGNRMTELTHILESGDPDGFETASPGAPRLARFMLKCMAEDQARVDMNDTRHFSEQFATANQPLVLQEDALDIAEHLMLWGYSKSGNVVSDALRYLVGEIEAKDANGHAIVKLDANRADNDPAEVEAKRALIRSIKLIACASREKALTPELKEKGARRIAFNNKYDPIIKDRDYASSTNDVKITMEGPKGLDAHRPESAMGTREGAKGFFLSHPAIRRACEAIFDYGRSKAYDPNRFATQKGRGH